MSNKDCGGCASDKIFDKESTELTSCSFTVATMPMCLSVVDLPAGVTIALEQIVCDNPYPYPCPAEQAVLSAETCSYTINKPGTYQLVASGGVGDFIVSKTSIDAAAFPPVPDPGITAGEVKAIAQACVDAADDEDTTYTFTDAAPNADFSACIITVTGSDGSTQQVTVPKPDVPEAETDGVHIDGSVAPVVDLAAGTITYQTVNDEDESAGAPLVQDISALIAFLTSPMYLAGDNITLITNPDGSIEISSEDTDTFGTFVQNADGSYTWTPADGSPPVNIAPPEDIQVCSPSSDASQDYAGEALLQRGNVGDTNEGCPIGERVLVTKSDNGKLEAGLRTMSVSAQSNNAGAGLLALDVTRTSVEPIEFDSTFSIMVVNPSSCRPMRYLAHSTGREVHADHDGAPGNYQSRILQNYRINGITIPVNGAGDTQYVFEDNGGIQSFNSMTQGNSFTGLIAPSGTLLYEGENFYGNHISPNLLYTLESQFASVFGIVVN